MHLPFTQLTLFFNIQWSASCCIVAVSLRSFGLFMKKLEDREYQKMPKNCNFSLQKGLLFRDALSNYGTIFSFFHILRTLTGQSLFQIPQI